MFNNIIKSIFTKGFVALINFAVFILSAKYLGASSRGEINILVLNIAVIQILNEIFTGYSLIYFMPKYDLKKIFLTGIVYTFMACSLGNSIFYFLQKQLPGYEWLSAIISLLVILNTFNCVLILGKEKINLYNFLSFFQPFVFVIGLCYCLFIEKMFTLEAFLFPMLVSFCLAFPISLIAAIRLVKAPSKNTEFELKPVISYGLICQAGVLMFILSNKFSFYLLPSKAEVGLYGTACSLVESVMVISNGISPVHLTRIANSQNDQENANLTLSLSKISFLVSLIVMFAMFALPNSLYVSLLGNAYVDAKYYMMFYAPGILIMSFISIINNYFSGIGKLKQVLFSNSLGFAATLIGAPFLVSSLGMKGAAITANLSYFLTAISITFIFFKMNKLNFMEMFNMRRVMGDIQKIRGK
jgi:O-antigen/teichoic acid export membrane protein